MKEGKQFFFEKNQKTSVPVGCASSRRVVPPARDSRDKSFLLLFLEREGLAFFFLLAAAPPQSCVDVAVGTAQSYACLNQQLGDVARQAQRPSSTDAPYSATSPSNVTGQFNEDATRNRLGANYGHSVTPQRPAYAPPAAPLPRH